MKTVVAALLAWCAPGWALAAAPVSPVGPAPRPTPRPAPLVEIPFAVRVGGESFAHPVMSAFVLPGGVLDIEVLAPPLDAPYELEARAGDVQKRSPTRWSWRAPDDPSHHEIVIHDRGRGGKVTLHVFVLVPVSAVRDGRLHGYRIGDYPKGPLAGTAGYDPPAGFVEVTSGNDETPLTPHFKLKQFVCKQAGGFPKYVVLDARLLLKLEAVLAAVRKAGFDAPTLHVMSGYRTPFYNAILENVKYSQHVFGHAADVFLDADDNDTMDDLDHDGKIAREDAKVLFDIVDAMDRAPDARFTGGLGLYGGTRAHGPFVHVDVRGRQARW
jgi:hypothetical protein